VRHHTAAKPQTCCFRSIDVQAFNWSGSSLADWTGSDAEQRVYPTEAEEGGSKHHDAHGRNREFSGTPGYQESSERRKERARRQDSADDEAKHAIK
jgi:hypothetical protein